MFSRLARLFSAKEFTTNQFWVLFLVNYQGFVRWRIKHNSKINPQKFAGELKYKLRNIIMRAAAGSGMAKKDSAMQMMQGLRSKLIEGQSIESVIQESGDSSNNLFSSDLGVLRYQDFAPQLKAALDGLPKGAYTKILETPQGFQIFYIEDILWEDAQSLEQATPEIEEILFKAQTEKEFNSWIEALRKNSHIKIIL